MEYNEEFLNNTTPGPLLLFGSGETSPSGRKAFEALFKTLPPRPHVALLETPAGFEPNSAQVIGRVGDFLQHHLQNYQPQITVIPARRRGTPFSPDEEEIVKPLLYADLIFMGPGSPTYAVRQLSKSLAWHYTLARHRLGAALALASAAAIAISAYALPVYEIYKVGEDLHWKPGLDFFGMYGIPLVFIPHWNNREGGAALDTSRCFMGQARFAELVALLPPQVTIIGLDEKTALFMDLHKGVCRVIGLGGVTLIHTGHHHHEAQEGFGADLKELAQQRDSHIHVYRQGETFPLSECCPLEHRPLLQGIPPSAWKQALDAQRLLEQSRRAATEKPPLLPPQEAPPPVQALVAQRQEARARGDYPTADALRRQIAALGWKVIDTPQGPLLEKNG